MRQSKSYARLFEMDSKKAKNEKFVYQVLLREVENEKTKKRSKTMQA